MQFEFATANRILFGPGRLSEVPSLAGDLGRRAFLLTGKTPDRTTRLLTGLEEQGIACITSSVPGEPTTDVVLEASDIARRESCDLVIAFGGGSVVDAGKAIAALLTNGGEPLDYLEIIGKGLPLSQRSAPYIAIPTTAGTGAEVTRNAVLLSEEHRVKVSMRSPWMLPQIAVVDPELTYTMPPAVTASTGLDALTQLLEAYVSNQANPLTDGICREGLMRAARSLRRAYECGTDASAREEMCIASLFGGLGLANAKLGAIHGFAGPLGGMFPAPHGVVCAALLPHVMQTNVQALQSRASHSDALHRYAEVARLLTDNPDAYVWDGVRWVQMLCAALNVPPLSQYGLTHGDVDAVVAKAQRAGSMKGNPIELTADELQEILQHAMVGG